MAPDCCFDSHNSSTCHQYVRNDEGYSPFGRANITQHCDWTPSIGVVENSLDSTLSMTVIVVGVVKLVRNLKRNGFKCTSIT